MPDNEVLSRLVRVERKIDRLLRFFQERAPSDQAVTEAVELFLEDALLPKWLED